MLYLIACSGVAEDQFVPWVLIFSSLRSVVFSAPPPLLLVDFYGQPSPVLLPVDITEKLLFSL